MRRPRLVLSSLMTLLVLLGAPAWLTWRTVRQERLNHELISALRKGDDKAALAALNAGAEGNAHDKLQDDRPIWRQMLDRLQGKYRPDTDGSPAVLIAFGIDSLGTDGGLFLPKAGNLRLMKALLDKGADPNQKVGIGEPLLSWVLQNSYYGEARFPLARLLLKYGANINATDLSGVTAFAFALIAHDRTAIRFLLENGANVNTRDLQGETVLIWAIRTQQSDLVRFLVDKGADVNAKNRQEASPLLLARFFGTPKIVTLLKRAGAKE